MQTWQEKKGNREKRGEREEKSGNIFRENQEAFLKKIL